MCRWNRLDEPILMKYLKPLQQALLLDADVSKESLLCRPESVIQNVREREIIFSLL